MNNAPLQPRPLPALDLSNTPFWTGGATDQLLVSTCGDCGYRSHPPVPRCPSCLSRSVTPQPVSGRGTVYSFTINHQTWYPTLESPYVVAIVELEEQEGVRLTTTLVGCEPDEVFVGMPVRVTFRQLEDVWLPLFERDDR